MTDPSVTSPTLEPIVTDEPVQTIGRYEVIGVLGEGAMGRVLLAHDPVLDRDVAIKHLRDDLKLPRDVVDGLLVRMRHEARAAARVAHPNLVVLHDMGEDPSVGLFLVFELVDGPTLKRRIEQGSLTPGEAARIGREIAEALTLAHKAGVLHRDVKPENVMLAPTGAKLTDFGIARVPDSTLTRAGSLLGTPAYSAPETFKGTTFSPKSDQFSLAATVFEALSGERPFPGDDAFTVAAAIATAPPLACAAKLGLPGEVDEVFAKALAKAPDERFESCVAFARALDMALEARAGSPAATEGARPWRKGQVVIGAVVVLGTLALLVRAALVDAGPTDDHARPRTRARQAAPRRAGPPRDPTPLDAGPRAPFDPANPR